MEFPFHGVGIYQPGSAIASPGWPHHDVIVVREGCIQMHAGRKDFVLDAGDALVIPPENPFCGEAQTPSATIWVLHFRPGKTERSRFLLRKTPFAVRAGCRSHHTRQLLEIFSELWRRALSGLPPRSLALLGETLIARIEEAHRRPPRPESPRLAAATSLVAQDRKVSVADMARAAGLGLSRFRQVFRSHHEMSPATYLLGQRMEHARQLLTMTVLPIKEIGQRAGYAEITAFHRAFRKATGTTPAAYGRRFGGGGV